MLFKQFDDTIKLTISDIMSDSASINELKLPREFIIPNRLSYVAMVIMLSLFENEPFILNVLIRFLDILSSSVTILGAKISFPTVSLPVQETTASPDVM